VVAVEELTLERREEALAHRVVVRVADRSHRRTHARLAAPKSERGRRVLASLIGVVDHLTGSAFAE
jgi:hypothetical protein